MKQNYKIPKVLGSPGTEVKNILYGKWEGFEVFEIGQLKEGLSLDHSNYSVVKNLVKETIMQARRPLRKKIKIVEKCWY